MSVAPFHILLVSSFLTFVGVWGLLVHRGNPMRCLIALHPVFWGAALNFISGGASAANASGMAFALFAVILTSAQTAAAIALFRLYFKKRGREEAGKKGNVP